MKSIMLSTAVLAALCCGTVRAEGQVSDNALAQMGLSGMTKMSDNAGKAVRGKFAVSFGFSRASAASLGGSSTTFNGGVYGGQFFSFQQNTSSAAASSSILGFPIHSAASAAGGSSFGIAF
jgi:hypothetical protein